MSLNPHTDNPSGHPASAQARILPALTGKNYQDAVRYCDEINYTCKFTYTKITDKTYTNNQIISQSIPGNYDMSLIRDKTITFEIAKVDKEQVETTKPNYLPIILTAAALLISIAVFVYLVIQNRRRKAAEVIAKERAEKEASDKNGEK